MSVAQDSTALPRRWQVPLAAKFLIAVLLIQGTLFLSSYFRWFWFNQHKGYTVLTTVAATTVLLLLFVVAIAASWFFKLKLQFSLGTMMLFVPVIAIPCGWLAREMSLARQQEEVVQWIESTNGLWYGRAFPDKMFLLLTKQPRPLVRELFGDHFFCDVDLLWVKDRKVLERIGMFHQLKELECHAATDTDMEHLRGLQHLVRLRLKDPQITDAGLKPLGELPALELLEANGARISGDGLKYLSQLKHIKEISLDGASMTDTGLTHLGKLESLEMLRLEKTDVTDAGLDHVHGLKELRMLRLEETKVTNQGVAVLEKVLPYCIIDN